ncbi:unnamed protein product [Vicia faba]|uniref:Uncharacterized protein n=1 Tax=Vicia faba TaxID=3906 RepID=A0AAV1ACZ0_VICFA|nr:unnamed protein product [Vicia faba]
MRNSMFYNFVNIKNDKESSAPLIKLFCDMYQPVHKNFVFNKVSFSFCAEEVAKVIAIKNTGVDFNAPAAKELPKFVYDLMTKFNIELFFISSPDYRRPRKSSWKMVEDLDAFEKVNWAKAICDNLYLSFGKLKDAMNQSHKQTSFNGCAPVFEATVFDRIPSLRPKEIFETLTADVPPPDDVPSPLAAAVVPSPLAADVPSPLAAADVPLPPPPRKSMRINKHPPPPPAADVPPPDDVPSPLAAADVPPPPAAEVPPPPPPRKSMRINKHSVPPAPSRRYPARKKDHVQYTK